jgi:hypothetical protein
MALGPFVGVTGVGNVDDYVLIFGIHKNNFGPDDLAIASREQRKFPFKGLQFTNSHEIF